MKLGQMENTNVNKHALYLKSTDTPNDVSRPATDTTKV